MERCIVGEIEGNDVIYIPSRDILFCKNTSVKFPVIESIIKGKLQQSTIPEKDLTIIKDGNIVSLGCLTTTMKNCLDIRHNVHKIKKI